MENAEEKEPHGGMVKLVSKEGHEFYVDRKCAMLSGTIRAMLSGQVRLTPTLMGKSNGQEQAALARPRFSCLSPAYQPIHPPTHLPHIQFVESGGEITFKELSTPILEKVIQYLHYKVRYTNSDTVIPEFKIEPEMVMELLMAANFLDC
mmetsp:Transcript_8200/g.23349  ORF Transcript_8200/g.23349 Transcript_8200/m.23349 type:complete len:149 (-) Transcript_8200:87-533(-)